MKYRVWDGQRLNYKIFTTQKIWEGEIRPMHLIGNTVNFDDVYENDYLIAVDTKKIYLVGKYHLGVRADEVSRFELIDNETSEIIKVNDLGYPIKLNGEQLELIGNKYEHLLRKKDKAKLKSYRKEIFLKVGLKLSNSLNESEKLNKRLLLNVKTSSDDELDDAILDFFNIKSDISKFQASSLDKIGLPNTSICPLCGLFPIGNDALWKYYWSWKGGTKLCICKDCYSKGLGKQKKSKGCYVATVAYGNENHDSVLTLKSFRDVILIRTYFGPRLIDIYYRFSPKIASKLEGQVLMNLFIKVFILNPIVRFIKLFYNL